MRALRLLTRNLLDAFVALLVVGGQISIWLHPFAHRAAAAVLLLLATSALFLRKRFPVESVVAFWALMLAQEWVAPTAVDKAGAPAFIAVFLAFWSSAAYNDRPRAFPLLALGYGVSALVVMHDPNASGFSDWGWLNGLGTVAWLSGLALHARASHAAEIEERSALLEARREADKRLAVAEERARIARELHDVVAHSVTVMTVQTGAVRRLLHADQQREREALEAVEQTGRQALVEMRRLLGVLRETEAPATAELGPQPRLGSLDALVEQVRQAGLPVELAVEGEAPELPPGVDVTAYRVVQEALTNALKHGGEGASARVLVRYRADAVEMEVSNEGRIATNGDGRGHGLIGMRERVGIFGGTVDAEPRDPGGFVVRARLPLAG